VELALISSWHRGTNDALACIASADKHCDMRLPAVRFVHLTEILVFLACVWGLTTLIAQSEFQAWLATAFALAFREVMEFVNVVQPEPLMLATYGLFALTTVAAYMGRIAPRWWALSGFLLGVTALVKPSFAVLIPLLPALLIVDALHRRKRLRDAVLASFWIVLPAGAMIAAWMARSAALFGNYSLTDPIYLEACLSHRLAYNSMTWAEWLGGWLYYLPDFGDDLSSALFGTDTLQRLGFGNTGSYYDYGADVLHAQVHAITAPNPATGYLIETYIVGEPVKFSLVSALLLWRGLFVGRLLGLAGLICTFVVLTAMPAPQRRPLLLLCLLGLAMAATQAALTVSIPRYNLPLIPVYAISLAWATASLLARFRFLRNPASDTHSRAGDSRRKAAT
jgi:4-amino-4-deoxy-L-arabinose transferase-like glycosyltransferase